MMLGTVRRRTRSDDEHALPLAENGIAISRRMQKLTGEEAAARPFRDERHAFVSGRDDDVGRVDRSCRGLNAPARVASIDPLHAG
jgi:hypothetical protein